MAQRSQASVALGLAVRDVRQRASISQEELGYLSGMHRTYVGGIERGERNPSWINIVKLAQALKVTPSDLVIRAEEYGWTPSVERAGG
jgi:transcriptional regulator with XRE-family HTH domain